MSLPGSAIPSSVHEAVVDFLDRVRRRFGERLLDTRLFGSYARGDWGPESDADVLVVVAGLTHGEFCEVSDLSEEADYTRSFQVSEEGASEVVSKTRSICEALRAHLQEGGWLEEG